MKSLVRYRRLSILVMVGALAACGGGGGSSQRTSDGNGVANTPPTILGTPPTSANMVVAGNAYQFAPTAMDPDGQVLTFSITNRPSWAQFDTVTGRLSGTPTGAHVGTYADITISVSDGITSVSLPAFTLTVSAVTPPPANNQPPTISGTPAQAVTAGAAYLFRPQASDPDGQRLTFSITNRPAWASFNAVTGELSGTPGAVNVGQTSNIVISVTDDQVSATLPAFSITVAEVQSGSATVRWTPPTTNEDGSPLTDLRGFRVYYGTIATNLDTVLDLPNPGLASAVIENLSPATWYFAVKAYNTVNAESSFSNVASKTIP